MSVTPTLAISLESPASHIRRGHTSEPLDEEVAAVGRIEAIKTVLRVLLRTTGLRLAVVSHVTAESWTCCAVLDEMNFGLEPGDTLEIATTFCNNVRSSAAPLRITHASADPRFTNHPAPRLYGVESYIAVPVYRRNGSFFGVLCAVDAKPAELSEDLLEIFRHLADLVGYQLEHEEELGLRDAQLLGAREAAQLREQLIGIVSHDLRSPLNAISLSAATLMRRTDLDDRARRGLTRILDSADRANRLILDLLDFTQVRMGKALPMQRKPMDLHMLAQQVVDEMQLAAPERPLVLHCEGDGRGDWDGDRIAQVLTNLLTNALKYSPADADIRIETRGEEEAVLLRVSNGGAPIPAHLLPTLFEPLTRGTQSGSEQRSIGLGLFIVDQIVRAHCGTVEVHSTVEAGTTFGVCLPRHV
ncbi:GAF domain-containing sensor histidine kinase [Archangium violaceum]|uniref:GAF domain-containing sensor histidine kinase n=1 Tax=Archangium violaceum TaxID=83451 RepID=UPI002B2B0F3D|nr:GAF domain-containing sensor histidine kinase [Archangium violaceum]